MDDEGGTLRSGVLGLGLEELELDLASFCLSSDKSAWFSWLRSSAFFLSLSFSFMMLQFCKYSLVLSLSMIYLPAGTPLPEGVWFLLQKDHLGRVRRTKARQKREEMEHSGSVAGIYSAQQQKRPFATQVYEILDRPQKKTRCQVLHPRTRTRYSVLPNALHYASNNVALVLVVGHGPLLYGIYNGHSRAPL
ncbi:hypothetical protein BHE74_00016867 [Ensete ventricosum]|nr:hypothetical protein BHE74_00016867 [Ensete ventricosum]